MGDFRKPSFALFFLRSQDPQACPLSVLEGSILELRPWEPMENEERTLGAKGKSAFSFPKWLDTGGEQSSSPSPALSPSELSVCAVWAPPASEPTARWERMLPRRLAGTTVCGRLAAADAPNLREQNEVDWELFAHTSFPSASPYPAAAIPPGGKIVCV